MVKRKAEMGDGLHRANSRMRYANERSVRSASSYRRTRSKYLRRTGGRYVPRVSGSRAMAVAAMEAKNIDTVLSGATQFPAATTTGVLALLNGCAQGTTANTRIGRKIMMKSLFIRGTLGKGATTTGEGSLRFMVVYDAQANATAPAVTDILTVDTINGINNLNNADRFKIIMDKVINFGVVDNTSAHIEKYKKFRLETKFNNGSAGTIGDIQTGSLYLITWNNNVTTAALTGGFQIRVRFYD